MNRSLASVVLALVLLWDPPSTNALPPCGDGAPLTDLDHYEIPIFRVSILGWAICTDSEGHSFECPIYAWTFDRERTQETTIDLADPGRGEVVGWEDVEAIDIAGNSSAVCP